MAKPAKQPDTDYKTLNAELEDILLELQREDLDIDTALSQYARGLEIVQQLETYLKTAANQVTELKAQFDAS